MGAARGRFSVAVCVHVCEHPHNPCVQRRHGRKRRLSGRPATRVLSPAVRLRLEVQEGGARVGLLLRRSRQPAGDRTTAK